MTEYFEQYREALRDRRNGIMSHLDGTETWLETKADFYADSRILSENALDTFEEFKSVYPPYGLVTWTKESYKGDETRPWRSLYSALSATGRLAVNNATPSISNCPYHETLEEKLGGTEPPLDPYDHNRRGLDTLRDVVAPGAMLNAALFVSLALRMPRLQRLHGDSTDQETFARHSVSLLREPLGHPQQRAAAFVFSLGSIREFLSPNFLGDELAAKFTKVSPNSHGATRLDWSRPTEDLTLRQETAVVNRVTGSERLYANKDRIIYPAGTRLGDIAVHEPTLGCPGNKLASAMWQRVIDVVVGEEMWDRVDDIKIYTR